MLILRRKSGESLLIGDSIKLTVMDVYEGGVRIAIDAPRSVTVLRSELVQAADANRDAAVSRGQARPKELMKLIGGAPAPSPDAGGYTQSEPSALRQKDSSD